MYTRAEMHARACAYRALCTTHDRELAPPSAPVGQSSLLTHTRGPPRTRARARIHANRRRSSTPTCTPERREIRNTFPAFRNSNFCRQSPNTSKNIEINLPCSRLRRPTEILETGFRLRRTKGRASGWYTLGRISLEICARCCIGEDGGKDRPGGQDGIGRMHAILVLLGSTTRPPFEDFILSTLYKPAVSILSR